MKRILLLSLFLLLLFKSVLVVSANDTEICDRTIAGELTIDLQRKDYTAFDKIQQSDIKALFVDQNGERTEVRLDDLDIVYSRGDSLRAGDNIVLFRYGSAEVYKSITADKKCFDLSETAWANQVQVYNSALKYPSIINLPNGLSVKNFIYSSMKDVGEYVVQAEFEYDRDNYAEPEFAQGVYTVIPSEVKIKINDQFLSNKESIGELDYRVIRGKVYDGDDLDLYYSVRGDCIFAISNNSNYKVTVASGTIYRDNKAGAEYADWIIVAIFLIVLSVFTLIIFKFRKRIERKINERSINKESSKVNTSDILSVDSDTADKMISDAGAKALVRREGRRIFTDGSLKCVMNLSDLNSAFNDGETVDINTLKNKNLIDSSVFKIRIKDTGVISKRLVVLANSFSLKAIKMIAMAGGEAHIVKSVRKR